MNYLSIFFDKYLINLNNQIKIGLGENLDQDHNFKKNTQFDSEQFLK
jgi:hypothetical protein